MDLNFNYTITNSFSFNGKTLHSGEITTVDISPCNEYGIFFNDILLNPMYILETLDLYSRIQQRSHILEFLLFPNLGLS